jgi:hypothetical protein
VILNLISRANGHPSRIQPTSDTLRSPRSNDSSLVKVSYSWNNAGFRGFAPGGPQPLGYLIFLCLSNGQKSFFF